MLLQCHWIIKRCEHECGKEVPASLLIPFLTPLQHDVEPFLRSQQLKNQTRNSYNVIVSKGTLPGPQGPATGPTPNADEPISHTSKYPISLTTFNNPYAAQDN